MAVAFGGASDTAVAADDVSVSTASITVSGSNTIGFVFVGTRANTGADIVTGVTWNGETMTRVSTQKHDGSAGNNDRGYLYYILAPTTGVATASASTNGNMSISGAFWTGARQSGQPDNTAYAVLAAGTGDITQSLVPNVNGCWVIGGAINGYDQFIAGTNTTMRTTGAITSRCLFDNNASVTPAVSTALHVYVAANNSDGVILMASIAPLYTTTTNYIKNYRNHRISFGTP